MTSDYFIFGENSKFLTTTSSMAFTKSPSVSFGSPNGTLTLHFEPKFDIEISEGWEISEAANFFLKEVRKLAGQQ